MRRAVSRGDISRVRTSGAFDYDDGLAAGATSRRAKTSRDVVEAHLGALHFPSKGIVTGASVNAADHALAGFLRGFHLGAVYIAHHGEQRFGLGWRMPSDAFRITLSIRSANRARLFGGLGRAHHNQDARVFGGSAA